MSLDFWIGVLSGVIAWMVIRWSFVKMIVKLARREDVRRKYLYDDA